MLCHSLATLPLALLAFHNGLSLGSLGSSLFWSEKPGFLYPKEVKYFLVGPLNIVGAVLGVASPKLWGFASSKVLLSIKLL